MIEIWTEDSTAGYRFIKRINDVIYNRQLLIVPHAGIADALPTTTLRHGGILTHLRNYNNSKQLVLLFIDKALDRSETAEHYSNVVAEARKHKNVMIIEQTCFELVMLSYNNLFEISGNTNTLLYNINNEFVQLSKDLDRFRPCNFSDDLKNYIKRSCNPGRTQYEHVAKVLLSDITNIDTNIGRKRKYLSLISKGKVGPCWMNDCCIIPTAYRGCRKCTVTSEMTLEHKMNHLVLNSFWADITRQIEEFVNSYFDNNYVSKSHNENMYKIECSKKYDNTTINKKIAQLIEKFGYWNYERLYRF